jgi:3-hydroxyisobutyrate dehydrogenase
MMTTRVAFLGLGTMGSGMARRLLDAGFPLTVYNRSRPKANPLVAAGAVWADTPRQAAADADAVIAMVSDDDASRALWLGHDGVLAGLRPGTLAVECSTLSPAWVSDLRQAILAERGRFLDAPVTGSRPQAAAGELILMVGGEPDDLEAARPVLLPLSRKILHVGGPGAGSRVKLINNFLAGVQIASLAEAFGLMARSGIDPAKAMEVIGAGAPGSPMIASVYQRLRTGDDSVYFYLHLMAKDLAYAQQEAMAHQLQLRTAAAAFALFKTALDRGDGSKDVSAVARPSFEAGQPVSGAS